METPLRTGRIAGVWFILTFVFSIPALILYAPLLNHADFVFTTGGDTRIYAGAFLEILLLVANIATALVFYPALKRQNESLALGYVASRILESAIIVAGVVSVLALVTMRTDVGGPGADLAGLDAVGRALVAFHDWTFLLGPQFCAGIGNGIILGSLMYMSGLVPRRMALLGVIGGPLAFIGGVLVLFGVIDAGSAGLFALTLVEIAWEASLGIYLVVKGYRPTAKVLRPAAANSLS